MTGKLITFEGPEGGGKSTQAAALAEALREAGFEALLTREPGGTKLGDAIRNLLLHEASGEAPCAPAELFLFCASRAQLCANVIRPALERGVWVILDRFTDSTLAYQGYGRGFDVDALRRINTLTTGGLVPDLTILLDISAETGLNRVMERSGLQGGGARHRPNLKFGNDDAEELALPGFGTDTVEREPIEFHKRLRDGFLVLADLEPHRFAVVNGISPKEKVTGQIRKTVWEKFALD